MGRVTASASTCTALCVLSLALLSSHAVGAGGENNFCASGFCYFQQSVALGAAEAEAHCQTLDSDAHLALPPNNDTFVRMDQAMIADGVTGNWWIGAVATSGCAWESVADGTALDYFSWYAGEPNGCSACSARFDLNASDQRACCVEVQHWGPPFDPEGWNDHDCDTKAPFFCQLECTDESCTGTPTQFPTTTTTVQTTAVTTTTTTTRPAAENNFCTDGACYFIQTQAASASDAEAVCQSLDSAAHIASPGDLTVAKMLDDAMKATGIDGEYWVGLYADGNCSWSALDGGSVYLDW